MTHAYSRKDRLADEIRDRIAVLFQGGQLNDPRLNEVTITAVKLSADLQIASVYYRVYSSDAQVAAKKGLESARGLFRRSLAKYLDLRRVPELRFFYDESVERGSHIEELLRQIH